MEFTAKEIARILNGTVEGDAGATAGSFARIEHGRPGQICFYANPKYERFVYTCKASILLVDSGFVPKEPVTPTLVRVADAYTAVATLLKYVSDRSRKSRRHRGIFRHVALSARIGRKVWVGDFTHIESGCRIGRDTFVGDNVWIGRGTVIGQGCIIYPGVRIYPGMVIGDRVILHANCVIGSDGFGNAPQPDGTWQKIEHLGNVIIGNDVEIGAGTTVDRAEMESTVIGNGVRIDNLCQIAHNVRIGDNTVMAAQCGVAGSTSIGKNCVIAGQVGIVGHLTIADNTTIGAQAGVIGNIRKSGETVFGTPAIDLKNYMRSYALFKQSAKEQ